MPTFTLKNIPDELKVAARLHRRSINSEVIMCLEKSLKPDRVSPEDRLHRIQAMRRSISPNDTSVGEIAQAINSGRS